LHLCEVTDTISMLWWMSVATLLAITLSAGASSAVPVAPEEADAWVRHVIPLPKEGRQTIAVDVTEQVPHEGGTLQIHFDYPGGEQGAAREALSPGQIARYDQADDWHDDQYAPPRWLANPFGDGHCYHNCGDKV